MNIISEALPRPPRRLLSKTFSSMAETTQTALAVTEVGKPLTKIEIPIPEPKEHQILLKLTATGIAPLDAKLRFHNIFQIPLPFIPTYDLVGTVLSHGIPTNTSAYPPGTHVMSQGLFNPLGGGLQSYALIDSRYAAIVPKNISDVDAALFPINGMTSFASLFGELGLGIPFPGTKGSEGFDYQGVKLVIIGGGSNCGKLAIQFAAIAKIGTIVVTASTENGKAEELKKLGATHVIDRKGSTEEVIKKVKEVVGDGLVYSFDTISFKDFSVAVGVLSNEKKGTLCYLAGREFVVDEGLKKEKGEVGWEQKRMVGHSFKNPDVSGIFWGNISKWIESGEVKVVPYKTIEGLDADKVNEVLGDYYAGKGVRTHVKF